MARRWQFESAQLDSPAMMLVTTEYYDHEHKRHNNDGHEAQCAECIDCPAGFDGPSGGVQHYEGYGDAERRER